MSVAGAVREDRLWQRHADMAKLGGTPKGGVNRQALSAEDAVLPGPAQAASAAPRLPAPSSWRAVRRLRCWD